MGLWITLEARDSEIAGCSDKKGCMIISDNVGFLLKYGNFNEMSQYVYQSNTRLISKILI